ncbi:MAG: phage portal protein [Phycisphaerae bacterium]|nr:phage portal protein [Phycisphaerae bacterium]
MIDWIANKLGFRRTRRDIKARFDAASNSPENREHWRYADGLAVNAAADPATRAVLRNRARHERFNNPFMAGQLRTLANDTIGVGPILQLITPNEIVNRAVERRWIEWARAVRLAAKLRLARITRACDGEVFIRLRTNPRLRCPVKLDLQLVEADQVTTPSLLPQLNRENVVDGIEFDEYDNPLWYYVLRQHPGDTGLWGTNPMEFTRIPADDIIHYFLTERPGQRRGIPECVSSLNITAERRNFRQSVLTAARAAASLGAAMLESEMDPDEDDVVAPFTSIPLEQGMLMALPHGAKASQMRPEQPSTNYGELDDRLIIEQARPLNMPRNIASGDSSRYNYASGRLDHQVYDRSNVVEQDDELVNTILTRVVSAWAIEATSIPGYLPGRAGQVYLPRENDPLWPVPCEWIWGERDHVDPSKQSSAQATRLKSRTTTYAREFARDRKDWRNEIEQSGREHEALDAAGLVSIDAQSTPRVLEVLRNVGTIGRDAAIELLTLMRISRPKAERMVSAALDAAVPGEEVPPRIRDRMVEQAVPGGNGDGHA